VKTHAKKEGITLSAGAAELLGLLGDGAFRDTLGMLQKVVSARGTNTISEEDVERIVGAPKRSLVHTMIEALGERDASKALTALSQAVEENVSLSVLHLLLLSSIRRILLLRFAKDIEKDIQAELPPDEFVFLKEWSGGKGKYINAEVLSRLLLVESESRFAAIPHLPLELAFMEILGNNSLEG
jgi:DNA polymerase III gamma/tau subunit